MPCQSLHRIAPQSADILVTIKQIKFLNHSDTDSTYLTVVDKGVQII